MMALEEDPGERTDIEILGAERIGAEAVLLTYRSYARSGATLRSSLWVLDGGRSAMLPAQYRDIAAWMEQRLAAGFRLVGDALCDDP